MSYVMTRGMTGTHIYHVCIYLPDLRRSAISFVYDDPVLFVIDHVSMSLHVCIYCIFEPCIHRARHAYHLLIAVPYTRAPVRQRVAADFHSGELHCRMR